MFMKKIFSFKWFITFLIIIWIGYWVYKWYINTINQNTTLTINATIKKWSINDSISSIWTADLINDQKIRFNQNGTISAIHVKQWDTVKKWKLLVELDKTDLNNSIKQAQVGLNDAKIKLQQDLNPAQQKDILNAQSSIDNSSSAILKSGTDIQSAQSTLDTLKQQKNNDINNLQDQIKAQQDAIDNDNEQLKLANDSLWIITKQEWQNIFMTRSFDSLIYRFISTFQYWCKPRNFFNIFFSSNKIHSFFHWIS